MLSPLNSLYYNAIQRFYIPFLFSSFLLLYLPPLKKSDLGIIDKIYSIESPASHVSLRQVSDNDLPLSPRAGLDSEKNGKELAAFHNQPGVTFRSACFSNFYFFYFRLFATLWTTGHLPRDRLDLYDSGKVK